jgi:hypothetical protein
MENKINRFSDRLVTEGYRVNNTHLDLSGEYSIHDIISELSSLSSLLEKYTSNSPLRDEVMNTLTELRNWREQGWKTVKANGTEWIPLVN